MNGSFSLSTIKVNFTKAFHQKDLNQKHFDGMIYKKYLTGKYGIKGEFIFNYVYPFLGKTMSSQIMPITSKSEASN